MTSNPEPARTSPAPELAAMEGAAELYHALLTGLILTLVSRAGSEAASELVFRLFRRKQQEQFLPGLEKLGLTGLPDAVAAAQYHYLSNFVGGVKVEYVYESDEKAWVRYPPPRWIWHGTAAAGIPSEVSAAMLRGWHAHNGVSLGNPRLGFVCTKQTVDGQPGLEGYYLEHDRPLEENERLRFSREESCPPFDPDQAPRLETADWPPERRAKAFRNYAMDYVKTALLELVDQFRPEEGTRLGGHAARVVGLQFHDDMAERLGLEERGPGPFAELFAWLARGQGEAVEIEKGPAGILLRQTTWRLMRGVEPVHPAVYAVWNQLWEGLLGAHDRFCRWQTVDRLDLGAPAFVWHIAGQ